MKTLVPQPLQAADDDDIQKSKRFSRQSYFRAMPNIERIVAEKRIYPPKRNQSEW
jgi:hypothetical protein